MANCILIIPSFFDYPQIIELELAKHYDNVFMFNSAPRGLVYKISSFLHANTFCRALLNKNSNSIKNSILGNVSDVEMILIVKASLLSNDFCKWLRYEFPQAKIVQYLWDNISTDTSAATTLQLFDENFSFSPEDCLDFGMKFRPFFYNPIPVSYKKDIDIACIASFSQDRAILLENILTKNNYLQKNRELYWHIKGSPPLFFKYRKYINLIKPYLQNSSVSYGEMLKILGHSKAQLDIPNPKQVGLTTRSFEALWTKTKIITTNHHIKNYDFFNESNVLVIDRTNSSIDRDWLDAPYVDLPETILTKYSLQSFVSDLIGISYNFNINSNGQQD